MTDVDLLVPSVLVASTLARDLLAAQELPHWSRVLSRTAVPVVTTLPPHAPLAAWQAQVFGERANVAELWAMACGIAPAEHGGRWLAEPAHFTIARDHLRLDDPRHLAYSIDEARALASAIAPVLEEAGWTLEVIEPATMRHWLLRRSDAADLSGAAIDCAIGDNVADWQPRAGDATMETRDSAESLALAWRRCVNEIQMLWFAHPVNDAREGRGQPAINTLWLSGNGRAMTPLPHYRAVETGLPLLAALPVEPDAAAALESFDAFIDVVRSDNWSEWRTHATALDARLGALIDAQARGEVGRIRVWLCGRGTVRTVVVARGDLGKFWRGWGRTPDLVGLFSDGGA